MTNSPSAAKLRVLPLAAVIFLTVSGGPYGLEPLLEYAGRDAALLLLLITPILWDIPAILTVLELNGMMPVTGGYYAWVKGALGLRFAFYEGWWTWLYTFADLAIYPVLFVTYASYFWPQADEFKVPVCLCIIWLGALLNILGIRPVGRLSILFGVMVLLPFLVMGALAYFGPHVTQPLPPQNLNHISFPALGIALYTVMWNFFGWDSATTYAGEVKDAARNYIKAIFIAFIVVMCIYTVAVITMQVSGIDPKVLQDGGFPVLGELIGGRPLGTLVAIGGLASALGLYNAVLLSVSRIPEVMAQDRLMPAVLNKLHPRFGTPWVSIVVCAIIVSLMINWTFTELIIIDVTLYGVGLFLEFASLVALRITMPDTPRPFKIRLPVYGLILMYLLPFIVYSIALSGAFVEQGSGFAGAIFAVAAVFSAEIGWQFVRFWHRKR